jgi:hypothetical protein
MRHETPAVPGPMTAAARGARIHAGLAPTIGALR